MIVLRLVYHRSQNSVEELHGVPENRHTVIITWPSDDAKPHDATGRLKQFLINGKKKRDFDHNHTEKLKRKPFLQQLHVVLPRY